MPAPSSEPEWDIRDVIPESCTILKYAWARKQYATIQYNVYNLQTELYGIYPDVGYICEEGNFILQKSGHVCNATPGDEPPEPGVNTIDVQSPSQDQIDILVLLRNSTWYSSVVE